MERKSVSNRCSVILKIDVDNNASILTKEVFTSRKEAKEYIETYSNKLIEENGIETIYQIALLDWTIFFKQTNIKMVVN